MGIGLIPSLKELLNLDELKDVDISSVADGDIIRWLAAQSLFRNTNDLTSHLANLSNPHTVTAAQALAVALLGNETIAGIKTFSSIPVLPGSNPTLANQAVRKAYADLFTLLTIFNAHKTRHQKGGADEVSVAGLSGVLAEDQPANMVDRYREIVSWLTKDGITEGGDAGYEVTAAFPLLKIKAADTTDYDAWVKTDTWTNLVLAGKVVTWDIPIMWIGAVVDVTIWLRLATHASDPPTAKTSHFGWKIIEENLYSTPGNNAAEEAQDTGIDIGVAFQFTSLTAVLTAGTNVKFYVDGVLKTTHTTRIPGNGHYLMHFHVRSEANYQRQINLGRFFMERSY